MAMECTYWCFHYNKEPWRVERKPLTNSFITYLIWFNKHFILSKIIKLTIIDRKVFLHVAQFGWILDSPISDVQFVVLKLIANRTSYACDIWSWTNIVFGVCPVPNPKSKGFSSPDFDHFLYPKCKVRLTLSPSHSQSSSIIAWATSCRGPLCHLGITQRLCITRGLLNACPTRALRCAQRTCHSKNSSKKS